MRPKLFMHISIPLLIAFLVVGCAGSEPNTGVPGTDSVVPTEPPPTADPALAPCDGLAPVFSGAFQAEMSTATAPFQDIVSGQTIDGCMGLLSLPSENINSLGDVTYLSHSLMNTNGWQEDMNFNAGGAGGIMNGYRKIDSVCTVTNEYGPFDVSLCSSDEPFTACMDRLTEDQKIYKVTLNCADVPESSTSPAGLPPASAPAVLPPAFDSDLVGSMVLMNIPPISRIKNYI